MANDKIITPNPEDNDKNKDRTETDVNPKNPTNDEPDGGTGNDGEGGTTKQTGTGAPAKTYTADDVEKIVQDRLERFRKQMKDDLGKMGDLQKQLDEMTKEKTVAQIRKKVASEKGVPESALFGEDEETCMNQADAILSFMQSKGYPTNVKDSGEPSRQTAATTNEQFAKWFEQQEI